MFVDSQLQITCNGSDRVSSQDFTSYTCCPPRFGFLEDNGQTYLDKDCESVSGGRDKGVVSLVTPNTNRPRHALIRVAKHLRREPLRLRAPMSGDYLRRLVSLGGLLTPSNACGVIPPHSAVPGSWWEYARIVPLRVNVQLLHPGELSLRRV